MKRVLAICFFLLSLCLSAQERLAVYPRENDDAPEAVRTSPLYGKNIVLFGDSYVQNGNRPIEESWHYKLARKYNMEYHNFGWNGNCLAYNWGEQFGPPLFERYQDLPDKADYVVVIAGHNDAVLIDRYGDSLDFFRSKLATLCEGLLAKYPQAKICFVTPWKCPQPMFRETIQTIVEVCSSYGIPVYDSSRYSGMHPRYLGFRSLYYQDNNDNAHLNARGHDLFFPRIERFLLGL